MKKIARLWHSLKWQSCWPLHFPHFKWLVSNWDPSMSRIISLKHILLIFAECLKDIGCDWINLGRKWDIVIAYSTLLAIMAMCALIFMPVFKKHLQFTKFMLFALQMVDVVFFLSLGIVLNHVFSKSLVLNVVHEFRRDGYLGQIEAIMLKKSSRLFYVILLSILLLFVFDAKFWSVHHDL